MALRSKVTHGNLGFTFSLRYSPSLIYWMIIPIIFESLGVPLPEGVYLRVGGLPELQFHHAPVLDERQRCCTPVVAGDHWDEPDGVEVRYDGRSEGVGHYPVHTDREKVSLWGGGGGGGGGREREGGKGGGKGRIACSMGGEDYF